MNLRELSDEELVALSVSCRGQDERPFTELFRRHRRMVWCLCSRFFRDPADLEDLVQETFFKAFRALHRHSGARSGSFRAWITTIAANACKNELRTRSRRPTTVDAEPPEPPAPEDDGGSLARLLDHERRQALSTALAALPAKDREILVMAELEQRPYPQIAEELGLTLSAVKMRGLRARAALAAVYREPRGERTA